MDKKEISKQVADSIYFEFNNVVDEKTGIRKLNQGMRFLSEELKGNHYKSLWRFEQTQEIILAEVKDITNPQEPVYIIFKDDSA
jgi:hypothetical protein